MSDKQLINNDILVDTVMAALTGEDTPVINWDELVQETTAAQLVAEANGGGNEAANLLCKMTALALIQTDLPEIVKIHIGSILNNLAETNRGRDLFLLSNHSKKGAKLYKLLRRDMRLALRFLQLGGAPPWRKENNNMNESIYLQVYDEVLNEASTDDHVKKIDVVRKAIAGLPEKISKQKMEALNLQLDIIGAELTRLTTPIPPLK